MSLDIGAFIDYITPLSPHLILIISALIAPAIGFRSGRGSAIASLIAGVAAIAVTGYLMYAGYTGTFDNLYAFNAFTGLMILLFLSVFILVTLMSMYGAESRKHHGEYFSLLAMATVGMMLVCAAEDMISLFVGLELANIMSFGLVAFKKNDPRSSEAAVKYLITSALSTALFLYGMSLVYGFTGSLTINEIIYNLAINPTSLSYMVAVVVLISGFAFKISVVPFHAWVPDVYEGAPTPITTFLAIGAKKMGFVVFFKLFLLMFVVVHHLSTLAGDPIRIHELQWVFAMLAAGTMTLGNVVAITQTSIKRMLAYSTIAQSGYIMIVLCIGTGYSMMGGLFYMIVHVFMKGGAFIVVAALASRGVGENITDYRGLARRAPLIAFAMMLFMFSLAGIPPLAGFSAKFILFSSGVTTEGTWIWLVAVAVVNSALSLYYYAKVVKAMYVDKGATSEKIRVPMSFKVAIAICAIAVIVIGVYPGPIIDLCQIAADGYIDGFMAWLVDFLSKLPP